MEHPYFKSLEQAADNIHLELNVVIDRLAYNDQGLIPVVTQDATSKDILMLAWMNKEALHQTLSSRCMTYWSRSRQQLWVKGETSGHTQNLVSMSFDCDGDAVLCQVDQEGVACHTGRANCFYLTAGIDQQQVFVEKLPS